MDVLRISSIRQKRSPKSPGGHDGDRPVCGGQTVDVLALVFLFVGKCPQNRRQDHARAMNPSKSFVDADGSAGVSALHAGRANRKVSRGEVQVTRNRSQDEVDRAIGVAGFLATTPREVTTVATRGATVIRPSF